MKATKRRRDHTYAIAWEKKPPASLVPHCVSPNTRFLYTHKYLLAFGAVYVTLQEMNGTVAPNEWPVSIGPRWLQEHPCIHEVFERINTSGKDLRYLPVFDKDSDIILALVWDANEITMSANMFSGFTGEASGNPGHFTIPNVPLTFAAHTAQSPLAHAHSTFRADGCGEFLD